RGRVGIALGSQSPPTARRAPTQPTQRVLGWVPGGGAGAGPSGSRRIPGLRGTATGAADFSTNFGDGTLVW
ncbi:MAG TPA: hypothetical protein VN203_09770, partial [Candidatus Acidoferrum sp.]|nr:hypothetical protein [Candidatus Acidoferrum sp.]